MSSTRTEFKLEPIRRFVVLAVLGHLVLAAAVWWWLQIQRFSAPRIAEAAHLSWMETADVSTTMVHKEAESPAPNAPPSNTPPPIIIRTKTPAPPTVEPEEKPVPKAILIRPPDKPASVAPSPVSPSYSPPPAPGEVSRFITVSRLPPAASASSAALDSVDRALIDSFLKAWTTPKAPGQRSVLLEVALDRSGKLASFKLVQPSGDKAVDASVLEAADRLEKVGESLPPSFVGERYSVQVRFNVE